MFPVPIAKPPSGALICWAPFRSITSVKLYDKFPFNDKLKLSFWIGFKFKFNSKPLLSVDPTFWITWSLNACPGGTFVNTNKSVVSLL